MNRIEMIPVTQLLHHPDNPRLDLGDLTELAESIKANGVMQNLTVVQVDDGVYNVVIGNRRMEAAKLAGLAEVPCVISEMDYKTQVATMLMENMQRQDLTVYEQAQGFQMMMDLGFTAKEIGEKTGFSEKTVKDRIKFTKFNQKNFEKAVAQGATLLDMLEVSKLTSKAAQNEVMKEAGTNNFRQVLNRKLGEQKYEAGKAYLGEIAKEAGMEPFPFGQQTWNGYHSLHIAVTTSKEAKEKILKRLKKAVKDNPGETVFYYIREVWMDHEAELDAYVKNSAGTADLTEEAEQQKERDRKRQKRVRTVKKLCAEAYKLRTDFIRNYAVTNGFGMTTIAKLILKYSLQQQNAWNMALPERHDWKEKYIKETLGIEKEEYEDKKSLFALVEEKGIPMIRATIAWMMGGGVFDCDSPENGSFYYYDGSFQNSEQMKKRYEFLQEIGYVMSDMEKQMLDGTHECYKEEE